jgi:hypothetical protein
MRSPFDDLGKTRELEPQGELVEDSALSCQEEGCDYVVTTGRYLSVNKILTWKCPDGHISKAKMNLD